MYYHNFVCKHYYEIFILGIFVKFLNFLRTHGRTIISYFLSAILVAIILPKYADYRIKKYDNQAAFNRLIYEQGLKPYRKNYTECHKIQMELFDAIGEEIGGWSLIKQLSSNSDRTRPTAPELAP